MTPVKILKTITLRQSLWLLLALSVGLTLSAFVIEYGLGAEPCKMCWWQRYAHWGIGIFAILGLIWRPFIGLLGAGLTAGIGLYIALWQMGAQRQWWALPSSCGEDNASETLSIADAFTAIPPRCDEINFTIFNLSLAEWNIPVMAGALLFVGYILLKNK